MQMCTCTHSHVFTHIHMYGSFTKQNSEYVVDEIHTRRELENVRYSIQALTTRFFYHLETFYLYSTCNRLEITNLNRSTNIATYLEDTSS